MKILINGYELKEIFELEFKIKKLKRNKEAYQIAVIIVAMFLDSTISGNALSNVGAIAEAKEGLIELLMFAVDTAIDALRYVCLGITVRDIIYIIVNGGSLKDGFNSAFKYVCLFLLGTMCPKFYGVK